MKKFKVEIIQHAYRLGVYQIKAPDEDAAYVLAEDIKFNDPRIKWNKFDPAMNNIPRFADIEVTEVKE